MPDIQGFDRITARTAVQLYELFGDAAHVARDPDNDDYVYRISDLAEMPGAVYASRRRAVRLFQPSTLRSRFLFQVAKAMQALPAARNVALGPDDADECLQLLKKWCRARNCHDSAHRSVFR